MNPLVSIIVPCYNQACFLSQALDSVLSQTYQNWECIIVNDGSSDNVEEVAGHYLTRDRRFRYLAKTNGGIADARNFGIKHSNGEYILPLDADDYIGNEYLSLAIDHFIEDPNCKVVYCKAQLFGCESGPFQLPDYSFNMLTTDNLLFCSAFYRRSDFDNTAGYNSNMVSGWEDWDFWLSLLSPSDKVFRIDKDLFFYRIKEQSRSTIANQNVDLLFIQLIKNHPEILGYWREEIFYLRGREEKIWYHLNMFFKNVFKKLRISL